MVSIILYLVVAASLYAVQNLYYQAAIAFVVSLLLFMMPYQKVRAGIFPISMFLFFTFSGNLFFHSGRILFSIASLPVTDEGLSLAGIRTLRVYSMIYGAKILTTRLSYDEIIQAFSRLLGPLERIGLPVKDFFSVMGLTLQSFPLLTRRLSEAFRKSRHDKEIRGFRNRLASVVAFILPIFIESIRSPEEFFAEGEPGDKRFEGEPSRNRTEETK
jgi:energy-coupling factor transport system permease protein